MEVISADCYKKISETAMLQGYKKLPAKYHANNKAWMTIDFFFISAFIRRKYRCAKQEYSPLCGQLCRTSEVYIISKKCKSHTVPGKLYKCAPAP
jgi:hypothetical protein